MCYIRGEADNSIEAILARSRRRELVARVGPAAVRYLPSDDPHAFLLPDNRLEPAERKWQKLFVALPWLTFAAMLALPVLIVHGNLPYLLQRAEHDKQAAGRRTLSAHRVPDFQVVNFGQMPDVLERPFPTMLILFHPATLASKVFLPVLQDLEGLLRKSAIPVSIAALDLTASPLPPDAFLWEYPAAVSPHIQLILPRSMEGEAGVADYDGGWNARSLAAAACRVSLITLDLVCIPALRSAEMASCVCSCGSQGSSKFETQESPLGLWSFSAPSSAAKRRSRMQTDGP
ncbi:unnamed protein product [Symbiodinium natans]|uniref:Uncharacterized protein n=1 Tax=Symbiodinium natans TaxID=878477 RepID=A0A812VD13_9DINO|nr:unnamed protein product [Symbiodinium natans]